MLETYLEVSSIANIIIILPIQNNGIHDDASVSKQLRNIGKSRIIESMTKVGKSCDNVVIVR